MKTTIKDGTYHKDIRMPQELVEAFTTGMRLQYSRHAQLAAINDRYGVVSHPPKTLAPTQQEIVEVEVAGGRPVKAVVRVAYDTRFDLALVVNAPTQGSSVVRTVWLNQHNDSHQTLNRGLYQQ